MPPASAGWMPTLWSDLECTKEDLSERFWKATASCRQEYQRLGFTECGSSKATRLLNPMFGDNGSITYLDETRRHFGQVVYTLVRAPLLSAVVVERVTIVFTAVFQSGSLSYTNTKSAFDPLPKQEVVRLATPDPAFIYQRFLEHLRQRPEPPHRFSDQSSLQHWFDSNQIETFEDRVRRGLFVRMSDNEVELAQHKLPPLA